MTLHRIAIERAREWTAVIFIRYSFTQKKKNGAGKAAVTLTDTYRWRSRMPFSRQIPAIHPAIRNIKMARRDKLIS